MIEATRRKDLGLLDLNRMLTAWLERVYHRRTHSETGAAPADRFTDGAAPRHATAGELHEAFLWSERRVVSKSATVSLHGNQYEIAISTCADGPSSSSLTRSAWTASRFATRATASAK